MSNAAAAGAVTMSDEEMDREWKPNARRPQSTVAQMFSQELMDIFRIDNSVADLDEKVDKRSVTRQTSSTPGHKTPPTARQLRRHIRNLANNC